MALWQSWIDYQLAMKAYGESQEFIDLVREGWSGGPVSSMTLAPAPKLIGRLRELILSPAQYGAQTVGVLENLHGEVEGFAVQEHLSMTRAVSAPLQV